MPAASIRPGAGQLTGSPALMMMVLLPLSIVLTVVMYCSFYPTYTTLFGKPSEQPSRPPSQ